MTFYLVQSGKNHGGMSLEFRADDIIVIGNKEKTEQFSIKVNGLQNEKHGDQEMKAQDKGKE